MALLGGEEAAHARARVLGGGNRHGEGVDPVARAAEVVERTADRLHGHGAGRMAPRVQEREQPPRARGWRPAARAPPLVGEREVGGRQVARHQRPGERRAAGVGVPVGEHRRQATPAPRTHSDTPQASSSRGFTPRKVGSCAHAARRATALLTIVAAMIAPAAARADGDPASDVLLLQDAYLPYFPAPAKPLGQTLQRLLDQVRKGGYPIKVALIQSQGDLGAYPELFDKPGPYAKLLASEIAFKVKRPPPARRDAVRRRGAQPRPAGRRGARQARDRQGRQVRRARPRRAGGGRADRHRQRSSTQVPDVKAAARPATGNDSGGGDSHTLLYVLAGVIVVLGIA